MILGRRSAAPEPVPVPERWRQVFESGEVTLHPFSPAELDAVALLPETDPPEGGLPYLLRLPLVPGPPPEPGVVARLAASGFVRPGPPAPPAGQIPVEFAGLAAADDSAPARQVALAGDLGLITYMRCRPLFLAEVYRAAHPVSPDAAAAGWQLVARAFVPYQMPGCLVERPPAPTGGQPPLMILREDRAAAAMLGWLGGDVRAYLKLREARAAGQPDESAGGESVATATVSAGFSQLARLSLAMPGGPQVVLRGLAVGTGTAESGTAGTAQAGTAQAGTAQAGTAQAGTAGARGGGHWLLTGEQLELAEPVTLAQLGDRLDDMLATASRPGAAARPDGSDAR